MKNNFKRLEELGHDKLSESSDLVKKNVMHNLSSVKTATNILELYFPTVIDLFLGLTGAKRRHKHQDNKHPDLR